MPRKKRGKRVYLNNVLTQDLMKKLNAFFESIIDVPRIRIGDRQTVETLINEEALLFATFLRNGRKTWTPRLYAMVR